MGVPRNRRTAKAKAMQYASATSQREWEAIRTNQVRWKIDTIEAAIQALQRDKVPITASRIRKRTGPSVSLDEIRQHVAADRFTDRRK
jgi:hypothetical protein